MNTKWYICPRIFYDWVRYGEDLTPEYAWEAVQMAVDIHADTMAFCVQNGDMRCGRAVCPPGIHTWWNLWGAPNITM